MQRLGFPKGWISRVMGCVTTPTFFVLINGKPYGHIQPSRGIRQGDHLSSYLFLLCVKGFTSLLAKAELEGRIHGVAICRRAPKISNLLFADDSLLFCRASSNEVEEIADILQVYAKASGQSINLEKSSMLLSTNTPCDKKEEIKETLGVKEVDRF